MARTLRQVAPTVRIERDLVKEFEVAAVAGIDEAGRGALAGPVFAAAVILPLDHEDRLDKLSAVRDSKVLTPSERERLVPIICEVALSVGIGWAGAGWIDEYGILSATRRAVSRALQGLALPAEAVIVDGPLRLVTLNVPQKLVVGADRLSLSVAAASILAKVSRDQYMIRLDDRYPAFGFSRHKGYGTAAHLEAIRRCGHCPEHRSSFSPIRTELNIAI